MWIATQWQLEAPTSLSGSSSLIGLISVAIPGIPLHFLVMNYFNNIFGVVVGVVTTISIAIFIFNIIIAYIEKRSK